MPLPCKPDSVHPEGLDGHFSKRLIPGVCGGQAGLPLLCLAPRGVYRAAVVAFGAVGSYPTFSPLPNTLLAKCWAVCFLWHFPSGFLSVPVPRFHGARCPVVSGLSSAIAETITATVRGAAGARLRGVPWTSKKILRWNSGGLVQNFEKNLARKGSP